MLNTMGGMWISWGKEVAGPVSSLIQKARRFRLEIIGNSEYQSKKIKIFLELWYTDSLISRHLSYLSFPKIKL